MTDMRYMDNLEVVVADAVELIREKTATYGDSWKRRGGPGAWFTTVRPIDRLEGIMTKWGGDIFGAIALHPGGEDGTALACVRDVMNYCILIEAHARAVLGVGPHGPARKQGCEWCGRPVPGVGDGVFCTTGCSDAKWEHDHDGRPYGERPRVVRVEDLGEEDLEAIRTASPRTRFTGTPDNGSHHALGEDVESAPDVTQDTGGAGGSGLDLRSLPPLERMESFEKAVRLLGLLFGVRVSCTDNVGHGRVTTIRVSPLD